MIPIRIKNKIIYTILNKKLIKQKMEFSSFFSCLSRYQKNNYSETHTHTYIYIRAKLMNFF